MDKKKRSKLILLIFILIVILVISILSFNYNYLKILVEKYVERYGLIAIAILSFLADTLDQPIGPEVPASFGVLFGLNVFFVVLFSTIGSYGASLMNYYIGRGYLSKRFREAMDSKENEKYIKLFKKYGGFSVFLAAISPVPWTLFCWLAGSFKMKLENFIFWGLIPRLLRIAVVVGVIYFSGISFV